MSLDGTLSLTKNPSSEIKWFWVKPLGVPHEVLWLWADFFSIDVTTSLNT